MPLLPLPTSSHPLPLATPHPLIFPHSLHRPRRTATTRPPRKPLIGSFPFTSRQPVVLAAATSDQELLQALMGGGKAEGRNQLPAVRTYENDLARLTLVGPVGFDQALVAAAADGGDAAEEHLSSGLRTMVVETVYPGGASVHSTVSTRLVGLVLSPPFFDPISSENWLLLIESTDFDWDVCGVAEMEVYLLI